MRATYLQSAVSASVRSALAVYMQAELKARLHKQLRIEYLGFINLQEWCSLLLQAGKSFPSFR